MTQDEIIEMAIQAGFDIGVWDKIFDDDLFGCSVQGIHENLEAFAKLVTEKSFEQGFYAGFKASGEGWNGECPFNDLGLDIQQNESVQHELKEAMENYQKG